MTFDRLVYIDRLKSAGVEEAVAPAHAEALRDALFETVATKADLHQSEHAVKAELQGLRADMQGLEHAVKADIQGLKAEMQGLEHALKADMQALERTVDRRIDALDRKIELTARDLVIKGAAGLVVLASLLIGLKVLG